MLDIELDGDIARRVPPSRSELSTLGPNTRTGFQNLFSLAFEQEFIVEAIPATT
jgi:hypothetical protein